MIAIEPGPIIQMQCNAYKVCDNLKCKRLSNENDQNSEKYKFLFLKLSFLNDLNLYRKRLFKKTYING